MGCRGAEALFVQNRLEMGDISGFLHGGCTFLYIAIWCVRVRLCDWVLIVMIEVCLELGKAVVT